MTGEFWHTPPEKSWVYNKIYNMRFQNSAQQDQECVLKKVNRVEINFMLTLNDKLMANEQKRKIVGMWCAPRSTWSQVRERWALLRTAGPGARCCGSAPYSSSPWSCWSWSSCAGLCRPQLHCSQPSWAKLRQSASSVLLHPETLPVRRQEEERYE